MNRQVLLVFCIWLAAAPALADHIVSTWSGTNNWSSASNWSPSTFFPNNGNGGNTYDVIVNVGAANLDQDISIDNLSLSGGTITGSNDLDVVGDLNWTGGQFSGSGTMTFAGGTISGSADKLIQSRTLQTSGDIAWSAGRIVRPNDLAPRGTVVVESGATLTASGGAGNRELDAHLQIDSGGKFLNTASTATLISHVVFHGPGGSLLNNGIVETAANTHLSIPGGSGNGTFIVRNNSVLSVLLNEADDFAFTGSIILDNGYFDAFVWNGGNLQFLLPSYLGGTGEILVDKLVNAREIAPGQSIGHLQLSGDYEQTQEGVLTIEIEGSNPNQVDRFSVSGNATLGGTLRVDASNLAPTPEATIEIVTAGSLSGTFDVIDWTGNEALRSYFYPVYGETSFGFSSERDGDMNHDGSILDSRDADLFVFALMNSSTQKWFSNCPECNGNEVVFPQQHGDFNNNGRMDFDDIAGFQSQLAGSGAPANALAMAFDRYFSNVPEPSAATLILLGMWCNMCTRRRHG